MKVSDATWAHGTTFLFRVGEDGRIENIPMPYDAAVVHDAAGVRVVDPEAWERGDYFADVSVTIDLWRSSEGRIFCGAVDVATVPGGPSRTEIHARLAATSHLGPDVTAELTASIWRQLPIGALIDQAMGSFRQMLEQYGSRVPEEVADRWRQDAEGVPRRAKPGPKPSITPKLLANVVAPAYLAGGRRPVVAVQEALRNAGFGSGIVTIDQARKAVVRARQAGLIPPATRKGKP